MPKSTRRNNYLSMPIAIVTAFAVVSTSLLAYTQLAPMLTGASITPPPTKTCTVTLGADNMLTVRAAGYVFGETLSIYLYETGTVAPRGSTPTWVKTSAVGSRTSPLTYKGKPGYGYYATCVFSNSGTGNSPTIIKTFPETLIPIANFTVTNIQMAANPDRIIVTVNNIGPVQAAPPSVSMIVNVPFYDPKGVSRMVQGQFQSTAIAPGAAMDVVIPISYGYGEYKEVTAHVTNSSQNVIVEYPVSDNAFRLQSIVFSPSTSSSSAAAISSASACPKVTQCFSLGKCVTIDITSPFSSCIDLGLAESRETCNSQVSSPSSAARCDITATMGDVTETISLP